MVFIGNGFNIYLSIAGIHEKFAAIYPGMLSTLIPFEILLSVFIFQALK